MRTIPSPFKRMLSICLVLLTLLSPAVIGFETHAAAADVTTHSCGNPNPTYKYDWDEAYFNDYHYTVCAAEGCTYRVKGDHVNRYEPLSSDSEYYYQNHRAICTICGNLYLPKHSDTSVWVYETEVFHARYCPDCNLQLAYVPHNYSHRNSNPPSPIYTNAEIHTYTCADCFDVITGTHQFENGKCTECEACQTHSWSKWAKADDATHSRSCSVCDAAETADHTWNSGTTANGVTTYTCTACSAQKTETVSCAHSWGDWVSCPADNTNSNPYHKRTCALCGASETADHTLSAWAAVNGNYEHHKRSCTADGCVYSEEHSSGSISIMDWSSIDIMNHKGKCSVASCDIEVLSAGHSYSYTASGDTIKGKCSVCGNEISCTLWPPLSLTYTGSPLNAVVSGATVSPPTIIYDGSSTTAPADVGKHTASITIGGAVASIEYEIISANNTCSHIWGAWALNTDIISTYPGAHIRQCTVKGCDETQEHYENCMTWKSIDYINCAGTCTIKDCGFKTTGYTHTYIYTANDEENRIYGECANCGVKGDYELRAPKSTVYNGQSLKASVYSDFFQFYPAITYDNNITPKNVGKYTAHATMGNATVSIEYEITPATLTPTVIVADKTYDRTADATVTASFSGYQGNDDINVAAVGTFADEKAGENKDVNVTFTLEGTDKGNYTLSQTTATCKADIKPAVITVSDVTVADKLFDNTTAAEITAVTASGILDTDDVTVKAEGEFEDANSGTDKDVTVTFTLEGTHKDNYTVAPETMVVQADITTKPAEEVMKPLDGLTPDNVEKNDKDTVQDVLDEIDLLLKDNNLTKEQEEDLKDARDEAEKLMDSINLVYKLTKGDGSVWRQKSSKTLTFTSNGYYNKFTANGSKVLIDGKAIDSKYFTAKEGSTIVTLTNEYLKTLSLGKHTISIQYADGSADGSFTVKEASLIPETGDSTNPMLYGTLLTVSLIGLAVVWKQRKRFEP